ncbi:hypothetical protein AGMMS49546_38990 [Spirochaetia bacterium]|nr:hypothetical protein AGMMS49546_38990 [Spirochaetia bacterium]
MKDLKVYLDTSIINFLTVDDSPDYRRDTELFFETIIVPNKVVSYISRVVIEEINDTKETEKREELLNILRKYPNIKMLVAEDDNVEEIAFLAETYMENGIIPRKKIADAFHIAYSTIFEMDILLSWNFKHLANVKKEQKISIINKINGYNYPFRMANPLEVLNDE